MKMFDHTHGTYVALELSPFCREFIGMFSDTTLRLDNPVDRDHLHTTVIYSRTPVPWAQYLDPNLVAEAYATHYEIFPTQEGKQCLVLRIESPIICDLNAMLTRLGATTQYDGYNPHLTLSYDYRGDIRGLPLPSYNQLTFDRLTVEPLDEEYIPPSK